MSRALDFDIGPLTWVKGEIDQALERGLASVRAFAAAPADAAQLRSAQTHFHQAHGALAIVGLDGVTRLSEEIEGFVGDLERAGSAAPPESIAAIERAVSELGAYLGALLAGGQNQPLKLYPAYRDLMAARGREAVDPADLYYPDLSPRPPKRDKTPVALAGADTARYYREQRGRYQRGLLKALRKDPTGAEDMRAAVAAIEAAQSMPTQRAFWWVALGFFDALVAHALPEEPRAQRLCNRIEQQIKRLIEGSPTVAERLMRETLYQVARARPATAHLRTVQETYHLAGSVPETLEPRKEKSGTRHALAALRELLTAAKSSWNKYASNHSPSLTAFLEQAGAIERHAGELGNEDFRKLATAMCAAARALVAHPERFADAAAMEVATTLLLLENAAERFEVLSPEFHTQAEVMTARLIACARGDALSGPPAVPLLDEMTRRAQERQLMAQLVSEIRASLRAVEQTLDSFFREPDKRGDLPALEKPLAQVRGALTILDEVRASAVLAECGERIRGFAAPSYTPDKSDFESIAALLSGLGFYVDALEHGKADFDAAMQPLAPARVASTEDANGAAAAPASVEIELAHAKKQVATLLGAWRAAPRDDDLRAELAHTLRSVQKDAALVADARLETQAGEALKFLDEPVRGAEDAALLATLAQIAGVAIAPPAPSAATERLAESNAETIDAELLGIFLEEATEVLETIQTNLATARVQPQAIEVLRTIRRGFHTLKGSGRMVGLMRLGEGAWSVEQVMNRWLEEERTATPDLFSLIEFAHRYFTAAIESLKAGGSTPEEQGLIAAAGQLKRGEPLGTLVAPVMTPSSATFTPVEAKHDAPSAPEHASIEARQGDASEPSLAEAGGAAGAEETPIAEAPIAKALITEITETPIAEAQIDEVPVAEALIDEALVAETLIDEVPIAEAPVAETPDAQAPSAEAVADGPHIANERSVAEAAGGAREALALGEGAAGRDASHALDSAALDITSRADLSDAPHASGEMPSLDFSMPMPVPMVPLEPARAAQLGFDLGSIDVPDVSSAAAKDEHVDAELDDRPSLDFSIPMTLPLVAPPGAMGNESDEATAAAGEQTESGHCDERTSLPEPASAPEVVRLGDVELSATLFAVFVGEAQSHLATLAEEAVALARGASASERLQRAAHTLAGIAATVHIDALHELAHALELALARIAGQTVDADIAALVGECVAELDRMAAAGRELRMPESATRLKQRLEAIGVATEPVDDAHAALQAAQVVTAAHVVAELAPARISLPTPTPDEPGVAEERDSRVAREQDDSTHADVQPVASSALATRGLGEHDDGSPAAVAPAASAPHAYPLDEHGSSLPADPASLAAEGAASNAMQSTPLDRRQRRIDDDLDPDLLPIFLEEAAELVPAVGQALRAWRAYPENLALGHALQRSLHTLKGSARMCGAMSLGELTHAMESRIENAIELSVMPMTMLDELEASYDRMAVLHDRLLNPGQAEQLAPDVGRDEEAHEPPAVDVVAQAEPASTRLEPVTGTSECLPPAAPEGATDPISAPGPADASAPASAAASRPPSAPVAARASAARASAARAGTAEGTASPTEMGEVAARAMLRVRADMIDRLVNEAGEVAIARSRIEGEMRVLKGALGDLTENVTRLRAQLREIEIQAESQMASRLSVAQERDSAFDPLEFDRFTRFQELTRMMAESVNDVQTVHQNIIKTLDESDAALSAQARLNRELQQSLMRIRMVPFQSVAERLYRVVRQAAKELDKRAVLDIRGAQVELDRSVLERITAPFEHLLRNAVAHGIETPMVRSTAGKKELGEIRIELRQEGNEVMMAVADDGAGIDLERVRAKAVALGLVDANAALADKDIAEFIFHSGFSTAREVSQIAGRGVGMDVVKSEVQALGGRVELSSERGKGTRFTIYLPLTLAVTQAVLVRAGGAIYAIPSALVEQVRQLKDAELQPLRESGVAAWQDRRYPFRYLPRLLGDGSFMPEKRRLTPVLYARSGASSVALQLEEVIGNQEIVVKNAGPLLSRIAGITGATVLGSGRIVLILNPVILADREPVAPHLPACAAPAAPEVTAPTVMIVDDSLTVRKITGRLLAREGYQVVTAKDGVDAMEQLHDAVPDVMLVDIEMPRMDGFDLTRNVRNDRRLKHVPIVMITSRTAEKHRKLAAEIGVDIFLGKPYQEDELLAHVAALMKKPVVA